MVSLCDVHIMHISMHYIYVSRKFLFEITLKLSGRAGAGARTTLS